MNDTTPIVGMAGTSLSLSLGQWNELLGILAGALTCVYMIWKLVRYYKDGRSR
jgi:hypothetical protein